jgi:hypothetical protein
VLTTPRLHQLRHHPLAAMAPIRLPGPAVAVRLSLHLGSFNCILLEGARPLNVPSGLENI